MSWHTPVPCAACGRDVIYTAAGWIDPTGVDPNRCPDTDGDHQGTS